MFQPSIPAIPEGTTFAGKTIIVTGANSGLGLEAARHYLVHKASRLILAVRNRSRGEAAVQTLRADPKIKIANPEAQIDIFDLDLDDYESVVKFARQVKTEVAEIDILLNNAGLHILKYEKSKSGHERVIQTNCYSQFILTLELLPLLRSTASKRKAPTRIGFTTSRSCNYHSLSEKPIAAGSTVIGHFDNEELYSKGRSSLVRYSDSKLVVNAFVRQLATKVLSSEVIVNSFCPGWAVSSFFSDMPFWVNGVMSLAQKLTARSSEEGARTLVWGAGIKGEETHGKFLDHNEINDDTPFLNSSAGKEFMEKLWNEMVEEGSRLDPELAMYQ